MGDDDEQLQGEVQRRLQSYSVMQYKAVNWSKLLESREKNCGDDTHEILVCNLRMR